MRLALALVAFASCSSMPPASSDAGQGDSGVAPVVDAGSTIDAGVHDAGMPIVSTTLRVTYPVSAGHSLFIRGSLPPLSWDSGAPMKKVNESTWEITLPAFTQSLEWKPLLDDATWSKGANYAATSGSTVTVAPRFLRDAGQWSRAYTFTSTLLGNARGVYVYLPPTYLENTTARMPVVYMHDGQNLFDPAASFGGVTWQVPEAMNAAANDGRFREAIVIGVENAGGARIDEYTPTVDAQYGGGRGDLYLRMLIEELKPKVDAELRTLNDAPNTVLLGSSLGGLISSYAGIHHADVFGCIGAMSPSTWWDDRVLLTLVPQTGATRPVRVYIDSGDSGNSNDDVTNTAALAGAYRTLGYVDHSTLEYVVQPGGTHTESAWASRLPHALEFLLGPR